MLFRSSCRILPPTLFASFAKGWEAKCGSFPAKSGISQVHDSSTCSHLAPELLSSFAFLARCYRLSPMPGRQRSIHLFRLAGVDVYLHWWWFLGSTKFLETCCLDCNQLSPISQWTSGSAPLLSHTLESDFAKRASSPAEMG